MQSISLENQTMIIKYILVNTRGCVNYTLKVEKVLRIARTVNKNAKTRKPPKVSIIRNPEEAPGVTNKYRPKDADP